MLSVAAADGSARFFLMATAVHLPDYTPQLPAAELAAIGPVDGAPLVLVVVNPGAVSTANLSAPIVANPATGVGVQVILDGSVWPLRHPLTPNA